MEVVLTPISEKFKSLPTYVEGFHDDEKIKKMVYNQFGATGLQTSVLGFGGSQLQSCYGTSQEQEGIDTVIAAVQSGINYIDTAPFYGPVGKAEIVLGKALKHIPRHAYYVATKVGRYGPEASQMFDFTREKVLQSVDESLNRLGLDYIDVLQVHDLEFAPSLDLIVNETLPALQDIKKSGKAKYIGITGYPLNKLKEVLERSQCHIDVVLSYCRHTLFDDSLKSYIPYFRKQKNLGIVNAAFLGMGLLTQYGPPTWISHPAPKELQELCKENVQFCKDQGIDIAELAFIHSLFEPNIDVHLVGMENQRVLQKNLSALDHFLKGLTANEKEVWDQVVRKFQACPKTHWENVEVEQYWEKMKSLKPN